MKNKSKVFLILALNFVMLCAGTGVAYHNTKTFGFDENARLVTVDNEKIMLMDFEINYNDIKIFFDKINDFVPDKSLTVRNQNQQIVAYI